MAAVLSPSIKVIIVEERNQARERIAELLTGEKNIDLVKQVSSYSELQAALEETKADLVLGDYFEFNKFCDDKWMSISELYPDTNILLYSDEDGQLDRIKVGCLEEQRIFDVRRIQHEVKNFIKKRSHEKKEAKVTNNDHHKITEIV
ncbi:MAG: hypothetical protein WCX65_05895 [bacterium]